MIGTGFSVAVVVSDAKKSARWFREKLGFKTEVTDEHWVTAWPEGASWRIHLCQSPRYKPEPGNSGIALYAQDLEGTVERLKKKGTKFSRDLTRTEWRAFAMVEDPDGNEFWLQEGSP